MFLFLLWHFNWILQKFQWVIWFSTVLNHNITNIDVVAFFRNEHLILFLLGLPVFIIVAFWVVRNWLITRLIWININFYFCRPFLDYSFIILTDFIRARTWSPCTYTLSIWTTMSLLELQKVCQCWMLTFVSLLLSLRCVRFEVISISLSSRWIQTGASIMLLILSLTTFLILRN